MSQTPVTTMHCARIIKPSSYHNQLTGTKYLKVIRLIEILIEFLKNYLNLHFGITEFMILLNLSIALDLDPHKTAF